MVYVFMSHSFRNRFHGGRTRQIEPRYLMEMSTYEMFQVGGCRTATFVCPFGFARAFDRKFNGAVVP